MKLFHIWCFLCKMEIFSCIFHSDEIVSCIFLILMERFFLHKKHKYMKQFYQENNYMKHFHQNKQFHEKNSLIYPMKLTVCTLIYRGSNEDSFFIANLWTTESMPRVYIQSA